MSERGHDPFRQFAAEALRKAMAAATSSGSAPLSFKGRALAWLASSEATWWWETVELSQSQALLRWGWIEHARQVLQEDEKRARDPVAREPKSVGTSHGTRGRPRLDPDTASLLREGLEHFTELQRRGRGAQQATRPFRPPTTQTQERQMGDVTDSTKALREAIRSEIEKNPQATAADLRQAVEENHDVDLPSSSFAGYHVPAVRDELGWEWKPSAQKYVKRPGAAGTQDPEDPADAEDAAAEDAGAVEERGEEEAPEPEGDEIDVPVVSRETGEAVELDDREAVVSAESPSPTGTFEAAGESGGRPTIDLRRNGKRYTARRRPDGRWDVHVEMDLPVEVAESLHGIAFRELFDLGHEVH